MKAGDEVLYRVWNAQTERYTDHTAILRTVLGNGEAHITWVDGTSSKNVNDVKGELHKEEDHWIGRRVEFTDDVPEVTTRPTEGDPIWYFVWDGDESEYVRYQAICRQVPGNPKSAHPKVHVTWVEDGVEKDFNNIDALEDKRIDARYWINRVDQRGDLGT